MTEDELRKAINHNPYINWIWISYSQYLSENFIREFQNKVDWIYISFYQNLSEEFIREFSEKVNWYGISRYQKKSKKFIKEFADKIDFRYVPSCYLKFEHKKSWMLFL